ncbi:MAG: hypothetical protein ACLTSZ_03540 [Lachnospiraceae bacterium]
MNRARKMQRVSRRLMRGARQYRRRRARRVQAAQGRDEYGRRRAKRTRPQRQKHLRLPGSTRTSSSS